MVDMRKATDVVLVYNKLSAAAVLAAALYQNVLLQDGTETFTLYDISQLVPDDAKRYVWIGLDPKANANGFFVKVADKKHEVFVIEDRTKPAALQFHPFKTRYESETEIDNSDYLYYPETLVLSVVKALDLDENEFRGLDFHLSRFHLVDADIEFLAFVYANIYEAQKALNDRKIYNIKPRTSDDVEVYLEGIRAAKERLKNAHMHTVVQNGERTCPAVKLAISDFGIHLAIRLTLLTHRNFVNMSMGLSGNIAYTNMRHIVFDKKLPIPLIVY